MTGNAIELIQENQSATSEVIIIVETAVKTLKADDVGIIDRLRMGRMRIGSKRAYQEKYPCPKSQIETCWAPPCYVTHHTLSGP